MDPSQHKEIIDEVYDFIKVYSDGTVERPPFPGGYLPACPKFVKGVASKDVHIDTHRGVWARLFLPESIVFSKQRVPVVLHFHGGGLCSGTPAAASSHRFCSKMAIESESIWVSVDYRLAPEHRLPAAYDDAHAAFMWLCTQSGMQASEKTGNGHADILHKHDEHEKAEGCGMKHAAKDEHGHVGSAHLCGAQRNANDERGHVGSAHMHGAPERAANHGSFLGHDTNGGHFTEPHSCINSLHTCTVSDNSLREHTPEPWLHIYADFSKCFLAGESSGGAIVHYLTMRIAHNVSSPVRVQGLLMIHAALLIEGVYNPSYNPRFERRPNTYRGLCLPVGATGNHPLVNPLHAEAPMPKDISLPPSIVAVADQDDFCAPGLYYAHTMRQYGHVVEVHKTERQGHCFYLYKPRSQEAECLFKDLVYFIRQHCKPQQKQSSL